MERCLVCGAELKPEAEWCGQCYAPRNTSHPAYRGPGAVDAGSDYADPRFRQPAEAHPVHYSRLRGGPTSMGAIGRFLTSVLALLLAGAVYMYVFPVMLGESGPKYFLLYAVVAVPVMLAVLRRVWRPTRVS